MSVSSSTQIEFHVLIHYRYEMYANEGRAQSAFGAYSHHTGDPQSSAESAPALELIEYANGDTIW